FLRDLYHVALRDRPALHDLCPHPGFAPMGSMQRLVDVHIPVQTRLGAVDHRAAYASPAWNELRRTNAKLAFCPSVFEPPLAIKLDQDIRAETPHVPAPGGMGDSTATQAGGGHHQDSERIDETTRRHRPFNRLTRVVGGVGKVLGARRVALRGGY